MAFKDITELTLGPPGGGRELSVAEAASLKCGEFSCNSKSSNKCNKRAFVESTDEVEVHDQLSSTEEDKNHHLNDMSFHADVTSRTVSASESPPAKGEVIGWPPVRSFRKKAMNNKYVKVGADGAPYLRKVDLENYNTYHQLLTALHNMFNPTPTTTNNNYCLITNIQGTLNTACSSSTNVEDQISRSNIDYKVAKAVKGTSTEYVPTYEDKDGDLMLVGDVPWKMFTESCKRIRLMKSSEAIGLAARSKNESPEMNR